VIIYAYNDHVWLLSPEPLVVNQPQSTRVEGASIVMKSCRAGAGDKLSTVAGGAPRRASRELPRPPDSSAASPDSAWLALPNKRLAAANAVKKTNFLVFFLMVRQTEFSVPRFFMADWLAFRSAALRETSS
jgi:hypothetical protein